VSLWFKKHQCERTRKSRNDLGLLCASDRELYTAGKADYIEPI